MFGGPPPPSITGVDRDLLLFVGELYEIADSSAHLALSGLRPPTGKRQLGPPPVPDGPEPLLQDLPKRKAKEAAKIRRVVLAWHGLKPEDGAPYTSARLWFTKWIITHGDNVREHLAGNGVSPRARDETQRLGAMCAMLALHVAEVVAAGYPRLADRLRKPERVTRIERAIRAVAASAKRLPWKTIVAAWGAVEHPKDNGPAPDDDTWRHRWEDYCLGRKR